MYRGLEQKRVLTVTIVLAVSLFFGISAFEFLILFYGLVAISFDVNIKWSAILAAILLLICPFILNLDNTVLAEILAIYAYYFLIIMVVISFKEQIKESVKNW